jgi:hypothetical protein
MRGQKRKKKRRTEAAQLKSRKLELVAASATLGFSLFASIAFVSHLVELFASKFIATGSTVTELTKLGGLLIPGVGVLVAVLREFFSGEKLFRMLTTFWQREAEAVRARDAED